MACIHTCLFCLLIISFLSNDYCPTFAGGCIFGRPDQSCRRGLHLTREPQNPTLTGYNGDVIATIEWMAQGNEQIR